MDTTTLNDIRKHGPCADGWERLLASLGKAKGDDEPLAFAHILESNGLDDALWALVSHPDQNKVRKFACDCAEHVLHLYTAKFPDDNRPAEAIRIARLYADGKATDEELDAARAAWDAAWGAARAAAMAARDAARAAAMAARDAARAAAMAARDAAWGAARAAAMAARDAEEEWQTALFKEYFCDDKE